MRRFVMLRRQRIFRFHQNMTRCMSSLETVASRGKRANNARQEEIAKHQNDFFSSYKNKVMSANVPRIEKIEVQYVGRNITDDATLLMNKRLSTPYQCAMHISQRLAKGSVLALVRKSGVAQSEDGTIVEVKNTGAEEQNENVASTEINSASTEIITLSEKSTWVPWDMNRPLEYDCELKLLNFTTNSSSSEEIKAVNKAYWRSCALILGAVAQEGFEENLDVKLAHLPDIPEISGAFCYDVELSKTLLNADGTSKWKVDESALISLTKLARHIISQNLTFEKLEIHREDAMDMFQHNEHFLRRIDQGIYTTVSPSNVPVYRFGKYFDICDGPLMPSTSSMYHFVVTAVHQLRRQGTPSCLWRFQGLSLPKQLQVQHSIWAMLECKARSLVRQGLPFDIMESSSHKFNEHLHKYKSIENETKHYNIATGQWLEDKWKTSEEKLTVPE